MFVSFMFAITQYQTSEHRVHGSGSLPLTELMKEAPVSWAVLTYHQMGKGMLQELRKESYITPRFFSSPAAFPGSVYAPSFLYGTTNHGLTSFQHLSNF